MARPPDQSFDGLCRDKDASQIILRRARNNALLEDGDPLKRSTDRNEELIAVTQRQLFLLTEDVTGTAGQTNGKALVASFEKPSPPEIECKDTKRAKTSGKRARSA